MSQIDGLKYGEIEFRGTTYYSDLVVWSTGKKALITKRHLIKTPLLKRLLKDKPQAIVVGVGLKGTVKIPAESKAFLRQHKIPLFVDKTGNAIEIYNGLVCLGRRVIGIMHVTL